MKKPKITKAVIAAAGLGTRLLPATKAMPKEMLPLVDKPTIQYIAEELAQAGIKEIIIVTSWQKRALEDHFDVSVELERSLSKAGKKEELTKIRRVSSLAHFIYLRQKLGKGNGVPALEAAPLVRDEPFLYLFGDDLIIARNKTSFIKKMIAAYEATNKPVMVVAKVPKDELHRFGIIASQKEGKQLRVVDIIEKPRIQEAPSNLAVVGYYVITPPLLRNLKEVKPGRGGEVWLTDALKSYLKQDKLYALPLKEADWYTVGEPTSYVEAFFSFAIKRPELKQKLRQLFKEKFK